MKNRISMNINLCKSTRDFKYLPCNRTKVMMYKSIIKNNIVVFLDLFHNYNFDPPHNVQQNATNQENYLFSLSIKYSI